MRPLVSIITPSYNQGKFIRETIESVLTQDYANIEYIIVDGKSTDNSLDIIREYEGRLVYISENDHGQSDAINKGFKMAHGEIIAWLNSDDVYEPGCIRRAVEEFERNDRLGLVYGDGYIIDENSSKLKVFEYTQEFDYWKLINFWDYIMQPATFFRTEMLKRVGYLDVNLHYCMDWDLWIKLAAISEVKYIPELLACSREYDSTKTSTGGDTRLNEITGLLQKYSGKEKPLGMQSYRASTFYIKQSEKFWPIRIMAGWYLAYKHKWLNKKMPIQYEDGWIGKEYAFIVPQYVSKVEISILNIFEKVLPLEVSIELNGIETKKMMFTENISVKWTLDLSRKRSKAFDEIHIRCSKAAKPGAGDDRKISIRMDKVKYTP